ncbi:MAG: hypothetical protein ACI4W2_10640 [Eubacterium sp.]
MRSQLEKNKEILLEEIEKYAGKPMDRATATYLNDCRGAYKAICLIEAEGYTEEEKAAPVEEKAARTVELDGDTEFEKLIISMPFDMAHAKAVASILADHMESLCVMNRRAYDNVMARIREVAKK